MQAKATPSIPLPTRPPSQTRRQTEPKVFHKTVCLAERPADFAIAIGERNPPQAFSARGGALSAEAAPRAAAIAVAHAEKLCEVELTRRIVTIAIAAAAYVQRPPAAPNDAATRVKHVVTEAVTSYEEAVP